jgi:molybdenum cofactor sulfurtransferase
MCAEEARSSVLAFFDAPDTEYTVIFTPNATGAMRLVGESFPFAQQSSFVLGMDSHNSINGIRQFALAKGAGFAYVSSTSQGGMNESEAKVPALSLLRESNTQQFTERPEDSQSPIVVYRLSLLVRVDGII